MLIPLNSKQDRQTERGQDDDARAISIERDKSEEYVVTGEERRCNSTPTRIRYR